MSTLNFLFPHNVVEPRFVCTKFLIYLPLSREGSEQGNRRGWLGQQYRPVEVELCDGGRPYLPLRTHNVGFALGVKDVEASSNFRKRSCHLRRPVFRKRNKSKKYVEDKIFQPQTKRNFWSATGYVLLAGICIAAEIDFFFCFFRIAILAIAVYKSFTSFREDMYGRQVLQIIFVHGTKTTSCLLTFSSSLKICLIEACTFSKLGLRCVLKLAENARRSEALIRRPWCHTVLNRHMATFVPDDDEEASNISRHRTRMQFFDDGIRRQHSDICRPKSQPLFQ